MVEQRNKTDGIGNALSVRASGLQLSSYVLFVFTFVVSLRLFAHFSYMT